MDYFKKEEVSGKLEGVYRMNIDDDNQEIITEEYDKWKDVWIDCPELLKPFAGLEPNYYIPITEEEAFTIVNPTKKRGELDRFLKEKLQVK